MTPSAYADLRNRVADLIAEGETDRAREAAIECKRLEALGLLGTEHRERLREVQADLAVLIKGRSRAAVRRAEADRGLC